LLQMPAPASERPWKMPETLSVAQFPGIRPESLGQYLAGLGLLAAATKKWPTVRGFWRPNHFALAGIDLSAGAVLDYLQAGWRPTEYRRWWKGKQDLARARGGAPLSDVRLLDCHVVCRGERKVYNPVLGSGGNVGRRDFEKLALECQRLTKDRQSEGWLRFALLDESGIELPDLPSTGTWFVQANKSFNSGLAVAREGQLSPWSYMLALEGALLLAGGVNKRLGSSFRPYGVFPFVSEAPAPSSESELGDATAEFWAPAWTTPARLSEVVLLLRRGLARVGTRAARAPHDFAAAALTAGTQAGVDSFYRFTLRRTTSGSTYEAVTAGIAKVRQKDLAGSGAVIKIADWADKLPRDVATKQTSRYYGVQAPIERALAALAEAPNDAERWWALLNAAADVQLHVDRNRSMREKRQVLQNLDESLFKLAWPEPSREIRIARSIASVGAGGYAVFHNIYGVKPGTGKFADERSPSAVWGEGDAYRTLSDVLERRLVDAERSTNDRAGGIPLAAKRFCGSDLVDDFASARASAQQVADAVPALSLVSWEVDDPDQGNDTHPAVPSAEFQLQALFRPIFTPGKLTLGPNSDAFISNPARARAVLNAIRAERWQQAVDLADQSYRAVNIRIVHPLSIEADCDRIAASLLIPMTRKATRRSFRRVWIER